MTTPNPSIRRILAVSLADIGDLVLSTPALAALRATYPGARLDVLTTPRAAPILTDSGLADSVITFRKHLFDSPRALLKPANLREALALVGKLRAGRYDAVLFFHLLTTRFGALKYAALGLAAGVPIRAGMDNGRGWFLTHRAVDHGFGVKSQRDYWLDVAALIGASSADSRLRVGINEADRHWAREQLPDTRRPYLAIHPGSGGFSRARRWEPEKFAAAADRHARHYSIVLIGGPDDDADDVLRHMQSPAINLVGKTTLNQLAAVLERCDRYLGTDSGLAHIAVAVGVPSVYTLFGPSNHLAWSSADQVYRSGVRCSPCSYVGRTVGLRHGCEARTCMKLIQVDDVPFDHPAGLTDKPAVDPGLPTSETPALHILGVPAHAMTFSGLLDRIEAWIAARTPHQVCTINPEYIMQAQRDVLLFSILKRADLCVADGVGVLWAARRLGVKLPERVTGSDGVPKIAERAAQRGWRVFLLGAAEGIAARTADILQARYPGLQIAGTFAGSPSAADEDHIAAMIRNSRADILFVAFGQGKQDHWIARNLPRLGVSVAIGVGGSFDFIAGIAPRAPDWMRRVGIEWLHRLITQPWRWRRMLRLPLFVLAVLRRGQRAPFPFSGGRP